MRVCPFVFITWFVACTVNAQSTDLDARHDAEARSLFDAGSMAFSEGRFDDAYERFRSSYELSHRPQLHYNIGAAADRGGHEAEALAAYEQYLELVPAAENRSYVEARVAVLRSRLPTATSEPAEPPASADVTVTEPPEAGVATTASTTESDPTIAIILFSLAGLTGGAAIGTGIAGWSLRSDLDARCPMHACTDPALRSSVDTMAALGITTDVLAGTSLALATAGLLAVLLAPARARPDTATVSVGVGSAELRMHF